MKSELAVLRDEWFKSDEGKRCLNPETLGIQGDPRYLRNRLEAAFLAGAIANEKCQNIICDKLLGKAQSDS